MAPGAKVVEVSTRVKMRKVGIIAAGALAISAFAAGTWAQAPAAASALPPAPARATMLRVCSSCHTPEMAAQQRLTADGWKDLVSKMADQGAVASEAELTEITAYLSASFPPDGGAQAHH